MRMPGPQERQTLEQRFPTLCPEVLGLLKVDVATIPATKQPPSFPHELCQEHAVQHTRQSSAGISRENLVSKLQGCGSSSQLSCLTLRVLQACLHPVPAKRLTCRQLLQLPYFKGAEAWFPTNFFPSAVRLPAPHSPSKMPDAPASPLAECEGVTGIHASGGFG